MSSDRELISQLRDIITTGTTISYLATDTDSDQWRIIGTTGNIINFFRYRSISIIVFCSNGAVCPRRTTEN